MICGNYKRPKKSFHKIVLREICKRREATCYFSKENSQKHKKKEILFSLINRVEVDVLWEKFSCHPYQLPTPPSINVYFEFLSFPIKTFPARTIELF